MSDDLDAGENDVICKYYGHFIVITIALVKLHDYTGWIFQVGLDG